MCLLGGGGSRVEKIDEFVTLARLDSGDHGSEWNAVDLSELAATTFDQIELIAEDQGLTMKRTTGNYVPVHGDRARLKQVIVNLLDNAFKYTPSGGSVEIITRTQGPHAILEVADTGIGIPESSRGRVFDRFYRVDRARSREMGGAGIGLSIVKGIVAAHQGTVEAEPNQPCGTRMVVRLPHTPGDAHPQRNP